MAVILSNFCGWEVMSSLGGHVKDPRRDIPRMILIAGIAIVGTQILGMAGILAALPLEDLSIVSGIADAMDLSFGLVLGSGAAATAAYDVVIVLLLFTLRGDDDHLVHRRQPQHQRHRARPLGAAASSATSTAASGRPTTPSS